MFRLPHDRRSRIQLALVAAFLLTFYFGVRYVADSLKGGEHFLEMEYAIDRGDIDEIKRQLEAGVSPNVRNTATGEVGLHVAIRRNNREVAELLLDRGANPNVPTFALKQTPLLMTIGHNDTLTKLLLDHGAKVDVVDWKDMSPLHFVARDGDIDMVRNFVERGAPLHGQARGGLTPGFLALQHRNIDVATYILFDAGGGDFSEENLDILLRAAASAGEPDLVHRFAEAGGNPLHRREDGDWSLHSAIWSGSAETVQVLIGLGATPDSSSGFYTSYLLDAAARMNSTEIITILLNQGMDVNGANPEGETALHAAARGNAADAARILIDNGAIVDAQTDYGTTPLLYAVTASCAHVLKVLLEHGADPSIANNEGELPMALARQLVVPSDQPEMVRFGADAPEMLPVGGDASATLELLESYFAKPATSPVTAPVTLSLKKDK